MYSIKWKIVEVEKVRRYWKYATRLIETTSCTYTDGCGYVKMFDVCMWLNVYLNMH